MALLHVLIGLVCSAVMNYFCTRKLILSGLISKLAPHVPPTKICSKDILHNYLQFFPIIPIFIDKEKDLKKAFAYLDGAGDGDGKLSVAEFKAIVASERIRFKYLIASLFLWNH